MGVGVGVAHYEVFNIRVWTVILCSCDLIIKGTIHITATSREAERPMKWALTSFNKVIWYQCWPLRPQACDSRSSRGRQTFESQGGLLCWKIKQKVTQPCACADNKRATMRQRPYWDNECVSFLNVSRVNVNVTQSYVASDQEEGLTARVVEELRYNILFKYW